MLNGNRPQRWYLIDRAIAGPDVDFAGLLADLEFELHAFAYYPLIEVEDAFRVVDAGNQYRITGFLKAGERPVFAKSGLEAELQFLEISARLIT